MSNKNEGKRLEAVRRLHLMEGHKEERYDRVVRIVRKILDVPFAGISVVDEARQWYKSIDGIDPGVLAREVSFCNYTIEQEEIFEVEDMRTDDRFEKNPLVAGEPNVVFYVGHPLKTPDGQSVGALCAADFRPRKLDADQREMLRDFSAIIEEQFVLGLLVNRDVLTGLYNRSFLDECLAREWRRHARSGSPLSLIFLDVDHFKEYNDEFGHLRGDKCLQQISG